MLTKNHAALKVEVARHLAADALIKGTYWNGKKGCFIGCLTHSENPEPAFERFGLPVPLLRICENIFEALSDDDGQAFFAAFPDAVACDDKDLSRVHWQFLAAELRAMPAAPAKIQAAIDPVINGMDLLGCGNAWPNAAAKATRAEAAYRIVSADNYASAYAASCAAVSAVASDPSIAAYAAAHSVSYAAAASDAVAARIRQRDTLLELIAAAPMGVA